MVQQMRASLRLPRKPAGRLAVACACVLAAAFVASGGASTAATSGSVVGATVLSATELTATACAPTSGAATDFGSVTAGASAVTTADCEVVFGSSNNSSQLRLSQADGDRRAMYRPATGALDGSYDGDGRSMVAGHLAYELEPYVGGDWITTGEACAATCQFDTVRWNDDGSVQWRATNTQTGCNDCMSYAVEAMGDGDIVLVGHYFVTGYEAAIMRLQPSGATRNTFDGDGYNFVARAGQQRFHDVVEQPGRGIVAVGSSDEGGDTAFFVARFTDQGQLDGTFGAGGIRVLQVTGGVDRAYEVELQADGSILVGGHASGDATVARLTPDGQLDTTFGVGGYRAIDTNAVDGGPHQENLGLDADPLTGDILMSSENGTSTTGTTLVARMNANGAMVNTFGTSGIVTYDLSTGAGSFDDSDGLFVEGDGRIVAALTLGHDGDASYLLRLMPDGTRDASFGTNGLLQVADGITDDQYGTSVASHSDGRLMTVAMSTTARLSTQVVADHLDTSTDWNQGSGMFGACLRELVGGATDAGTFAIDGNLACTAIDTDPWNDVAPLSSDPGAKVAYRATAGTATARLRFGLRTPTSQVAGRYVAPVRFEVLAPNA